MKRYLALLMGSNRPDQPQPDEATVARGMAAWGAWMAQHAGAVEEGGGPCGRTKLVGPGGISDIKNDVSGYLVVKAADQQAAAEMFIDHPHFTIFPGTGVEIMEILPIPGAP
jgi:hypothetical protein